LNTVVSHKDHKDDRQEYERRRREAAVRRSSLAEAKAREEQAVRDALSKRASRPASSRGGDSGDADVVFRVAPRLAAEPHATAVRRLLRLPAIRRVADWSPRGKGRDTLFRSLGEHRLAKYPVPALFWAGFFDVDVERFAPMVAHVAAGGSLFQYVTATGFPVPLTRRMCHELLSMPSGGSLLQAIRRVQVRSTGGDDRLLQAWMSTREARSVGNRADEAFWSTVLAWLSRADSVAPSEVAPLVDYIGHRRRQDDRFSVSGRSTLAMTRAMNEWHRELAVEKVIHGLAFEPSGYTSIELDRSVRGRHGGWENRIWRVDEVLSTKELAAEGRRMNHCVYSYAWSIQKGQSSIWSMTLEDGKGETGRWAMLTIEVRRDLGRVVQARGRFNRPATTEEHGVLLAWAGKNGLEVSLGNGG
jgi:hypothetical protein